MPLDNLAIAIGSRTADVQSGLASVKRSLSAVQSEAVSTAGGLQVAEGQLDDLTGESLTLSAALQRVAFSADDASDEINEAGRSAVTTGGLFSALTLSTDGLSFSMGALSTTMTAALIPALLALSTTLVPLAATFGVAAAALGGLAGAFGLVIGTGAIAHFKELKETFAGVRAEMEALLGAVGEKFGPLLFDALNALPTLLRDILVAVGPLDAFADALREMGTIALDLIPAMAGGLADLARQALPLLINSLRWLQQNGGSIWQGMLRTARQVAPLLKGVGQAFVSALPAINRFGTALLKQLLPALSGGIRGFGNLLDKVIAFTKTEQFGQIMKAIRQAMVELGPEVTALKKNLGELISTLVKNAPAMIRGFTAFADSALDVINALTPVLKAFIELVGAASKAWANWTKRSEQQEQNLGKQGLLGYAASGTMDTLQKGVSLWRAPGRATREQAVRVTGTLTTEGDEIVAKIDERVDQGFQTRSDRAGRISGGFD